MANRRQLALRDPGLAALVGVTGADFGGDFGDDMGDDFGDDMGGDDFGDEMGDDMGGDFGDDMGEEFGAAPARVNPKAAVALWRQRQAIRQRNRRRSLVLNPNRGSCVKLEQYIFPLNPTTNPVFGTASTTPMTNQPDTTIRPKRVSFSVPSVGVYTVAGIKIANVDISVGGGASFDAFFFNPQSVGMRIDAPTLSPSNRATISGSWSTFVPTGFNPGDSYPLSAIITGPAKMAG